MANMETAVTSRGKAEPKAFHFRAAPVAFDAIKAAGIDVVTFANNHVLDYGQVGLADTLAAVKAANFPYVGIGRNARGGVAHPASGDDQGRRIAILGVSQVDELQSTWVATDTRPGEAHAIDQTRTLAAIKAAQQQTYLEAARAGGGTLLIARSLVRGRTAAGRRPSAMLVGRFYGVAGIGPARRGIPVCQTARGSARVFIRRPGSLAMDMRT
jgi:hypothetical protein